MLISPLLLHVGIAPEVMTSSKSFSTHHVHVKLAGILTFCSHVLVQVTAATCSFMVFFSSTMSAFQYVLLGMENTDAALIFAIICFAASFLGLLVVQRAIHEYGRSSLIVFSVSIVMALSTVLMTTFGAVDVWRNYVSGKYMGFKLPC